MTVDSIIKLQHQWAARNGIIVSEHNRIYDLNDILKTPLSCDACAKLSGAGGQELASKMNALHSSSALVYNVFEHWRNIPKAPLVHALRQLFPIQLGTIVEQLSLERPFSTGLRGTAPHLDVAMVTQSGRGIAVESKFTEHYSNVITPVPMRGLTFRQKKVLDYGSAVN